MSGYDEPKTLLLELERGSTNAIPMTLQYADVEFTIVIADATAITFEDGERIEGYHSVLLFASRLARTMPSKPKDMAMVDVWMEFERDSMHQLTRVPPHAQSTFVASVLRRIDDHLRSNECAWLSSFGTSSAADFCWIARILWFAKVFETNLADFPHAKEYSEQDPRDDVLIMSDSDS